MKEMKAIISWTIAVGSPLRRVCVFRPSFSFPLSCCGVVRVRRVLQQLLTYTIINSSGLHQYVAPSDWSIVCTVPRSDLRTTRARCLDPTAPVGGLLGLELGSLRLGVIWLCV